MSRICHELVRVRTPDTLQLRSTIPEPGGMKLVIENSLIDGNVCITDVMKIMGYHEEALKRRVGELWANMGSTEAGL